jgi:subtilisin family serine protease
MKTLNRLGLCLLVTALAGCSFDRASSRRAPERSATPDFVDNEFVFAGERAVVERFLRGKGVAAEIFTVGRLVPSYQVRLAGAGIDVPSLVKSVRHLPGVEFAEPNYTLRVRTSTNTFEWPNDKMFFKLWGLNNVGQSAPQSLPGTEGADIKAIEAWGKLTSNDTKLTVAVIDSGIDYTHPDLKSNMWINQRESPAAGGVAGVDDDGNGYVDDVYGFDFVTEGRAGLWHGMPGDPDPMDDQGHGTHCAGTIAAAGGNGVGVVGVAPRNVRLMAVKFLSAAGSGSMVSAARAIEYAIVNKADIMSNSWGGGGPSELLTRVILKAQAAGVLFVAAAGNDSANNDVEASYPASFDEDLVNREPIVNVLAVGASDNKDNPAVFSNYGAESVDVFAPGVSILSTVPVALVDEGEAPYQAKSGTSMATPHVAGVAALMMAHDPGLRGQPQRLIDRMIRTADVRPSLVGLSRSNGRVNAARALSAADQPPVDPAWTEVPYPVQQRSYASQLVDIRREIKIPGARAVKLHFDFIQIDDPVDSIYLYDGDYRLIQRVEKAESVSLWSAVVPGDTVIVRFVNSIVRERSQEVLEQQSEAYCLQRGAESVLPEAEGKDAVRCEIEAATNDAASAKVFTTFNSQGYSVDRVAYLPGDEQQGRSR